MAKQGISILLTIVALVVGWFILAIPIFINLTITNIIKLILLSVGAYFLARA